MDYEELNFSFICIVTYKILVPLDNTTHETI